MGRSALRTLYVYAFFGALFFERAVWINYLSHVGYSVAEIGALQTLLTLAAFASELPSGILAERFGSQKVMIVGHLLIAVYIISMLCNIGYVALILGFVSYGIGLSLISGSDQTLLHATNPEQSYQHKIGIFEAISILGLAISSVIGGYLTTVSWEAIFCIELITQAIAIGLLLLIRVNTCRQVLADEKKMTIKQSLIELINVLKSPKTSLIVITISLFQSSMSVLLNFVQLLFGDKHISPFLSSIIITVGFVFSAIASLSIEKISNKIGNLVSITVFMGVTVLALLSFLGNGVVLIVAAFILLRFGFEFVDTSLNVIMQEHSTDAVRTSVISSVNTLTSAAMFVETILVTWIFSVWNVSVGFAVFGGVCVMLTIILFCCYMYLIRKESAAN